jgi:type II secretory pathway pseudopilin PulG
MKRLHCNLRSGFTLLEATLATAVFGVVGYGLAVAVGAGQETQKSILSTSVSNKEMRQTALKISSELRSCTNAHFAVSESQSGFSQIDFRMPITDNGTLTWGVHDKRLGPDSDEQNRPDWSVRYIVEEDGTQSDGAGGVRRLVRQLLDENEEVRLSETVIEGLRAGHGIEPGFSVLPSGDMWNVTIRLSGHDEDQTGSKVEFDVWMHN